VLKAASQGESLFFLFSGLRWKLLTFFGVGVEYFGVSQGPFARSRSFHFGFLVECSGISALIPSVSWYT